jgi:hypothetical protein
VERWFHRGGLLNLIWVIKGEGTGRGKRGIQPTGEPGTGTGRPGVRAWGYGRTEMTG